MSDADVLSRIGEPTKAPKPTAESLRKECPVLSHFACEAGCVTAQRFFGSNSRDVRLNEGEFAALIAAAVEAGISHAVKTYGLAEGV